MRGSVPVRVILPRSWRSDAERRFPVVYLLHGGNDDYTSWTRETDVEELTKQSDVLIVMPDAGKAGYYSDWYAGSPLWETFHTVELVRLMERVFRASSARAVIGLSMGGFGALNYAAHHRGMFRYVASMSSYVDLNDPAVRVALNLGSLKDGVNLRDVWGDPRVNADIWRAHNPAAMPRAFRGTRVHLSSGDGDIGPLDANRSGPVLMFAAAGEAFLPRSIARFATSLRSAGVEVSTHLYSPGTHSWPYWERELHAIWPTVTKELA
ncbi:alpha/beta hydrolase [Streptomyces sp. NPDC092370]|uniref:alpha/beta hydrolase n=1 Tax=Streptomyces sp. NPDC092370 TaxID=3366016 RepID=UPI00382C6D1C